MLAQLKYSIHRVVQMFGIDITRYPPRVAEPVITPHAPNFSDRRMKILRDNNINLVFDVGGNVGHYAIMLRKLGYTGKIVSFEPVTTVQVILKEHAASDEKWQVEDRALGDYDGSAEINVAGNTCMSSSLLSMSDRHAQVFPESIYISTQTVKVNKIDTLSPTLIHEHDRVYLKIDVQGYEMSVLKGAVETFPKIHVIEAELNLTPLYEGQSLPGEIMNYLNDNGYDMVAADNGDIEESSSYTMWIDAIFVRRNSS